MADKGKKKEKKQISKYNYYEVSGDTLTRKRKSCPRCGQGVFLAEHGNRLTCGKCGYTEFRRSTPDKQISEA